MLTVISDYRLVPYAKFPEPVEDIRDAIGWVIANADEVLADSGIQADFDHVFLMSHSAGSALSSTLLLHTTLLPPNVRARIHGVILQGGAYTFKRDESTSPDDPVLQLYGSWDSVEANMPAALLRKAPQELLAGFPKVIVFVSERELDGFTENSEDFTETLKTKLGRQIPIVKMKDHNHLSPHWALGTGEGEEWADDVTKWIKDNAPSAK